MTALGTLASTYIDSHLMSSMSSWQGHSNSSPLVYSPRDIFSPSMFRQTPVDTGLDSIFRSLLLLNSFKQFSLVSPSGQHWQLSTTGPHSPHTQSAASKVGTRVNTRIQWVDSSLTSKFDVRRKILQLGLILTLRIRNTIGCTHLRHQNLTSDSKISNILELF